MPALITHDMFGRDIHEKIAGAIGNGREEVLAFLLGNQGPDPLFYAIASPRLRGLAVLGHRMHAENPHELIAAFRQAASLLSVTEVITGRAYVLGFLCHYALDSTLHPLVYAQLYALCDAGIEGLSRKNAGEVHAVIESEFDELVLSVKRHTTIAAFHPAKQILLATPRIERIVSHLYANAARLAYGVKIPIDGYAQALHLYRRALKLLYSPRNIKRSVVGAVEERFRPYSFYRAMSMRNIDLKESDFDNHDHLPWENPFTHEITTASFWDLYEKAQKLAIEGIELIDVPRFEKESLISLTGSRNFSGEAKGD